MLWNVPEIRRHAAWASPKHNEPDAASFGAVFVWAFGWVLNNKKKKQFYIIFRRTFRVICTRSQIFGLPSGLKDRLDKRGHLSSRSHCVSPFITHFLSTQYTHRWVRSFGYVRRWYRLLRHKKQCLITPSSLCSTPSNGWEIANLSDPDIRYNLIPSSFF